MEQRPNFVDPVQFADWLIIQQGTQGSLVTPVKLQKLMYFCQAWHLVFFDGHPLFNEAPEAWSLGPVYRKVYDVYKKGYLRHQDIIPPTVNIEQEFFAATNTLSLTSEQKNLIQAVIDKYSAYSEEQLVLLTHSDDPWNEARRGCEPFTLCAIPINLDTMKSFYSSRLKKQ